MPASCSRAIRVPASPPSSATSAFAWPNITQKSLDWANRVIETIQDRAGLLIAVAEHTFRFPHRSFQEYLAAVHLTKDKDFASKALALVDRTGYWREVIKWAAGRVTHADDVVEWKGFALLRKLCPNGQLPAALPWHRVWLAGEALLEMSLAKVTQFDEGPELVTRIRGLLKQVMLASDGFTIVERAQAGTTLGLLGDDRPGLGTCPRENRKDRPDMYWTPVIQPDDFLMGGKITDWQDEPQFIHRLQHPFCVAVYPVTVAQFELFIQDGGYTRREFWTKDGWQWREQEARARPSDYEVAFQTPNHPRVDVTWHEAVAFCNWLNSAFTTEELKLPETTWKIRLATEAEWERAARHTDGRDFPWDGNEIPEPAQLCNCLETRLDQTNAVGVFTSGKAVCGAYDMAGNVWEWTGSQYGKYPYDPSDGREKLEAPARIARVLRGGSWDGSPDLARCAYRLRGEPDYRFGIIGFRVVATPFVSGD
jgi:formylglycine-generating enzyme required for sulfatase activity